MYGIADLDNCYCSCEKVFRPDLEGKPIVVLSNNDGCVVARCAEKLRTQKTVASIVGIFVNTNAIKHDFRSKNPTTRWSDIIKLR